MLDDLLTWIAGHGMLIAEWGAVWLIVLLLTIVAVRYYIISIPPDHFAEGHRPLDAWRDSHPALRFTVLVVKNLVGGLLTATGLIMLVTPGPGWFALLLGLSLVDLPGKRALERRIVRRPTILHLVNRVRARAQKPELRLFPLPPP